MIEQIPFPGTQLSDTAADEMIKNFKKKFYFPPPNKPALPRIWLALPENIPSKRITDDAILSSATFLNQKPLLFWIESNNEVYLAPPRQIAEYFEARNPWEDWDTYVFDEEMKWCIIFTHGLMHGVEVFQVGQID